MITCKFVGKLGNNMYQTAATIKVAEEMNTDFVIPTHSHAGHYGELPTDFDGFSYEFIKKNVELPNKFFQPTFGYTSTPKQNDLELNGFFQAHQYFDDVRDKLIKTYYAPTKKILEKVSAYEISPLSLGISVRRGDYLMLQHNHCVLSVQFYQSALSEYFTEVDQIFVFSDDFPWCKDIFGEDAIYVEEDKFVQLHMMTQMKHLIISNSTFAWWGAYLNDNKGVIVIPDPWFGPSSQHHDTSGLYCPNWIRHKHEIVLS